MSGPYSQDVDQIDVRYVARLARLQLTDEEAGRFQGQLDQVLGLVRELGTLNVDGVEPTAHAIPVNNIFRKDETKPCMDRDKALANAPLERHGQFVVPKIVE
jgi:aspartyl-tRNA(Asn)/glutamyl-tRNA(Gln) amidotransferase subunit C